MLKNGFQTYGKQIVQNQNLYKYNSKELQTDFDLDWYDYGARFYDAQLGRFHTLDPLAEKYSLQSPFAYTANNPIRFVDFMGMGPGDPPGNRNYWINRTIGPTVNAIDNKVNNAIDLLKMWQMILLLRMF